jgi:hypothetical protein
MRIGIMVAIVLAALVIDGGKTKAQSNAHRQSPAHAAQQTDNETGRSVVIINQQTPHGQENSHPGKPPSYLCRLFAPENVPSIALVLVGIAGIITAIYTLRTIRQQTRSTEKSAKAALLNAQAVINAERAWLDIDLLPVRPGESGLYCFRVWNHGKTPGFVTGRLLGRGYWDEDVSEIPPGSTGTVTPEKLPLYNIIAPNTAAPINILTFDVVKWPQGEEGQFVTYHGQLMYKDIFKQEHRTEIVYRLHRSSLFLEHLPKYTRYITKTEQGEEAN